MASSKKGTLHTKHMKSTLLRRGQGQNMKTTAVFSEKLFIARHAPNGIQMERKSCRASTPDGLHHRQLMPSSFHYKILRVLGALLKGHT